MTTQEIANKRIEQFIRRLRERYYGAHTPLQCEVTVDREPIPLSKLGSRTFEPIRQGSVWAGQWDSAWFRFAAQVPADWQGAEAVALIDTGSEACVFRDGSPWIGLTNKPVDGGVERKRRVPLGVVGGAREGAGVSGGVHPGERVELLVEAAANQLFGARSTASAYRLNQAELATFDRDLWQLVLDLEFLFDLASGLPPESTRSRRIIAGLNQAANAWAGGSGRADVKAIAAELLSQGANASAPTVWSVGHGHLDLAWLWPIRESRRKGGRTFATQLRLLEEYPDYVFGASQPQLFEWVHEDYPALYERVRSAVKSGRFEVQGAMWVEPDMNLSSGEALVRQCLYGKRYFACEFGVDIRHLWLPDVFGYSAALPQILRGCGVDVFMTQKISWNERNTFPHHTFVWEGIDGSRVRSHFLPTNTYNHDNRPSALIASEHRFAEGDKFGDFLNLYGVGDGGAGPSREHIERGLRGRDTEGAPKFRFAPAEEFFEKLRGIPEEQLPLWQGELYLELHRGTYTTQARMKQYNRRLEHLLHDVELLQVQVDVSLGLAAAPGDGKSAAPSDELDGIWKDTLLTQFHDILPGSSIGWVYRDAHEMSQRNLARLTEMRDALIRRLVPNATEASKVVEIRPDVEFEGRVTALANTLPWERSALVSDSDGERHIRVPASGYAAGEAAEVSRSGQAAASSEGMENEVLRLAFAEDGSITSIYRLDLQREYLAGTANQFTLWEDLPYSWDAWDISHYYRETRPERARLIERTVERESGLRVCVRQSFVIGNSKIVQLISLDAGSAVIRFDCRVDWREEHKHLRVGAETAIRSPQARYEIQYGTVERPTVSNTSWDEARFEVAAHRFVDLSRPDAGFALINDCKYGHRVQGGEMELTLLRSPKEPDPDADIGEHAFAFGYMAHEGEGASTAVLRAAHEMNAPVLAVVGGGDASGGGRCFFSVSEVGSSDRRAHGGANPGQGAGANPGQGAGVRVKLETVKRAEDGKGVILRLYETEGSECDITLNLPECFRTVEFVDMLEHPLTSGDGNQGNKPASERGVLALEDGTVTLRFLPFEIRTLRVQS